MRKKGNEWARLFLNPVREPTRFIQIACAAVDFRNYVSWGLAMKVSSARLERAIELRDAALRILARIGYDAIIADSERGYCHRTKQAKINELTILYSRPEHGNSIDLWKGRKVFSIAWRGNRIPYVMAFRSGDWERALLCADAELTWTSVKCSAELKSWLSGGLPDDK
jgi:hypothetical protein